MTGLVSQQLRSDGSAKNPVINPFEADRGWSCHRKDGSTLWFRGHAHGQSTEQIAEAAWNLADASPEVVAHWLDGLNGHFALLLSTDTATLAAVDPVRTFPLLWAADQTSGLLIDHDGPRLAHRLGLGVDDIDKDQAKAFALAGYTVGNNTLFPAINTLGPGEFLLHARPGTPQLHRYHRWQPWAVVDGDHEVFARRLGVINEQIMSDLVASASGRPILVPLSAGLDSRLIASGLVEAGYPDVRTFSYGLSGNREANVAHNIADRLGVPWTFVPYSNRALADVFRSPGYRDFMARSDSLTSIHFPQDYFALSELRRMGQLPDDAIVVNGQTGDFIAGNHIPHTLRDPDHLSDEETRLGRVIDGLLAKHFKHWKSLLTPDRLEGIRRLLRHEIDKIGGLPNDPAGDHGLFEYCEFQDRQSKYVVNGQRLYEVLGLEWRLPLWERGYLNFWETVPVGLKYGEKLYREVLLATNWGGVWNDLPLNPTRIRPGWIRPVRLAAKSICAPFGRATWHRFEKQYLEYHMANLCTYAAVPYAKVASDRRGFASAIAWHIEAYLNGLGLAYDGSPRHV